MSDLTSLPEWKALESHCQDLADTHMRDLFATDPERFDKFSLIHEDLLFDFSKNRITDETLPLLFDLARVRDLEGWREKMFTGEHINTSEDRAVLHTAMRNRSGDPIMVEGEDIMPGVRETFDKLREISDAVRDGKWTGHSGKRITDVVNLCIGGQFLGVQMLSHALVPYCHPDLTPHFVANVDGSNIAEIFQHCDPETTLFLVSSKSFTTQETMANAATARQWILDEYGEDETALQSHFIALTNYPDLADAFGIAPDNVLTFQEWVGGRFSSWSCSCLIIAICFGMDKVEEWLDGAYSMDQHFRTAPMEENIPVILALLGIWYRNFWDMESYAITPYDYYLRYMVDWVQQIDMESLGKGVTRAGNTVVNYQTGVTALGFQGSISQHTFIQLVHQGTQVIPTDFIIPKQSYNPIGDHHNMLISNFLAQTEALMVGREHKDSHRAFPGNRPTNSIVVERMDAYHLGMLMSLYEHKIFVQSIVWDINGFDQFGVELGKELADKLLEELKTREAGEHDSSTTGLLKHILKI